MEFEEAGSGGQHLRGYVLSDSAAALPLVFLNGTSSSGKTSISTELINQKEVPFYHLSIDDFFNNYNDFINNKFPNEPPREIDHQVVSQYLMIPYSQCITRQLNCYQNWVLM